MSVLKELLEQEEELQFDRFNQDTAWQLGCRLKANAEANDAAVAIEIYAYGQVVFAYAMPGTGPDNQDWLFRKRNSVLRYGHSSFYLGQYNHSRNRDFEAQAHIDAKTYCAHGGAFPLRIRNNGLVGCVAVSGLPQQEDHALVVTSLRDQITGQ